MEKIKLIVTVLCLQFLALSIFAQEQGEPEAESQSSSLKNFIIVENVREHEFNPHLTSYSSDAQILTGLYEGLFTYDPVNLNPCYAIAINYRISRDKKRWTFTINPDAKFSNGEKITAESVRKSWLKLLATPGAPYSSLLDVIKGAEDFRNGKGTADDVGIYANSEDSLSIHLVKPANYLPKVLCHSAFSVVHEKSDVYSGPFYLAEGSPGFYQMKKNEYYWDKDKVSLEQILFYQSDNEKDNAFYFNTGLADWITANVDTSLLYNKKAISIAAEFATSYFFFKQNDSVWSKTEFRQALLEAVPWEILRKDFYVAAQTFVYPLSGYPQLDGYSYTDMNEAKNLMQQARKKYDIPEDKKLPLVFEMPENSVSEDRLTALCDSWAQLGVDVQIKFKKSYEYYTQVGSSNSDMFIYTWIGDFADPLAFLELFRGNSTLNDSKWINSDYDRLLDEAAECSDEERYRLLAQAEKILLDDCEIIPVHHPVISNVVDKSTVGGWSENAFDIHPLKYLYKKADKSTVPNVVMK
ncbi:MAG: peptide ABC transporter substrate-binding protein [Treponema sp.]|nr:peptide ABC transporter substrate-binding protein [Treponema sp.]